MKLASDRLAALVLALLLPAVAGSLLQGWRSHQHATRRDDCANRRAFLDLRSIPVATRGVEKIGKRRIDGYVIGTQRGQAPMPFTLRATYLQPEWLVRPTLALPGPREPDRIEQTEFEVDGELVPLTFAYEMGRSEERFTAYIFAYDHSPTLSPFLARLLDSPGAIVTGVLPITYLGISGGAHPKEIERVKARAREWLALVWRHYRSTCTP